MTPEGKVKRKVNSALRPHIKNGAVWKFMPVQTGYGMPSLDYMLCVNGRFICIETKEKGKKPTPRQEITIADMKKAGGIVYIVDDDASLGTAMRGIEFYLSCK